MTEKEFRNKERAKAQEGLAKSKKKKKRRSAVAVLVVLLCFLLVAVVSVLAAVFLRVEGITVSGNSLYSATEVIECLGIKEGDSLLFIGEKKLSEKIQKELPFVTDLDVKIKFPNKVTVSVTETQEELCYFDGQKFFTANSEGKILKEAAERPENMPVVMIGDATEYRIGEYFICENQNKNLLIKSIIDFSKTSSLNVTVVSVRDIYNAYFVIDDSLLVELGSVSYLEQKLQFVPKTAEMMKGGERNVIDLSGWNPDNNEAVSYEKNITEYISLK